MKDLRRNAAAPLTREMVATGAFERPFALIDVGASQGIDPLWRAFEPQLEAVGFDILVREVQRLNRIEENPKVRYEATGIVAPSDADTVPEHSRVVLRDNQPFERSAAAAVMRAGGAREEVRFQGGDEEVVLTGETATLDAWLAGHPSDRAEFLKIDTDGSDYQVLRGAGKTLAEGSLLGLLVESQFHGPVHPNANLFSNIDLLLRGAGFTLFDLSLWHYSRAILPDRFLLDIPAQSMSGQVLWGDALYLRDLGDTAYEEMWSYEATPDRILKTACLFELFGLFDCAAELLEQRRVALDHVDVDVDAALDVLAEEQAPGGGGYRAIRARFRDDADSFFPGARA